MVETGSLRLLNDIKKAESDLRDNAPYCAAWRM